MHNRTGARASFAALWEAHPAILSGLWALLAANALLPLAYRIHPLARTLDFLSVFILAFGAAGLAWRRSRREGPAAFGLLGLGAALGGLRYAPTLLHLPHAPLLGPAISILSLVALGGGFLLWPQQARMPRDRIRTFLDGIAIATSLFTLAWMATGSMASVGRLSRGMVLLYMIQIGACLAVLTLWLLQETRLALPEQAQAKRFVRWSLVVLLAYSSIVVLLRITGHYIQNYLGDAAEVLHQTANALLVLAALSPATTPASLPQREKPSVLRALIPTMVSLAVLALAAIQIFRPQGEAPRALLALGSILMAVLVLRHGLLILDLERLSQGLEDRVEVRTRELEAHHREALNSLRVRMMAGLAAGLAHDLNNILGILRMRLELLRESCSPTQLQTVEILEDASERAISMTRRILESGRFQDLAPVRVSLPQWLAEQEGLWRALLRPGQRLEIHAGEGLWVVADPQSLDQILQNLVSNARDAMGPGGILRISAGPRSGAVRLDVRDDGPGIPPGQLDQLFEPFYTTKPSGTGLGLATVRNLVLQNRGAIQVESAPGQGTVFSIDLPVPAEAP
ncbi:MAG: HAMP domain-containing histidine kinase [Geothrix sp.]|uniref:sensor histidine kinase n=1 Tax=Geothrix sp. TaxID=1962974 RepID=UPI0018126DD6|nr:HAMP domain-containing sensor histidine kinase [Geothrix sp.]NWJ41455.1 HAMP domain-containing histidine kinase [Geothrix sp.]WIL20560.1 MAG: HAMP domain-containing histidine kinase [Geothrix sp.]